MESKLLKTLFTFLIFIAFNVSGWAQEMGYFEKFQEAVQLDEELERQQALEVWTQLAKDYPMNGNVQFRAGRAHLESFNQKKAALPYLERALALGIDKNYDPISPYEKKSPMTLYYYLGKAYHINYDLEEAETYYKKFMETAPGKHFLFEEAFLGQKQVDSAEELMKFPVEFEFENAGPIINSEYPDYAPVISIDENALFFTSRRLREDSSNINLIDRQTGGYYEDIYASYKNREGLWQKPELLSINTNAHTATVNVSPDGQKLYIYQDDNGDGNIYESKLVGETWSEPVKLGEAINSSSWETHIAITADENTAYFISNRKGGEGGRDIWQSKKLPTGKWGKAVNLGPTLNTPFDEDAVFISPDEQTIYFSSEGHNSIGGFDIFTSTKDESGEWTKPVNIGYPINTTDDDIFFVISADGKRGYYSSVREDGYGDKDIYVLSLPEPAAVQLALLKGVIIPAEGESLPDDIVVSVTNLGTGTTSAYTPRARDGVFVAILPLCYDYEIEYQIGGKTVGSDSFTVGCESSYQEVQKELLLSPVLVSKDGKSLVVSTSTGKGKPAEFKKYFGYNEMAVEREEEVFRQFMINVKELISIQGEVSINVVGSASKVPTRKYASNNELADQRARNAKERVLNFASDLEIDTSKINFTAVEGKVQGPTYSGDPEEGREKYREYQYVEIKAR